MEEKIEISYVASLGIQCYTAKCLQSMFKNTSYPFDWIVVYPKNVIDCIDDNFKIFLDKNNHYKISEKSSGHKIYGDGFFSHYNITNDDHYLYYEICVDRFMSLLEKTENKLFMITDVNAGNNINDDEKNEVKKLSNYLYNKTLNFYILYIKIINSNSTQSYEVEYDENIIFLNIRILSSLNPRLRFVNSTDGIYIENTIKNLFNYQLKNDI